MRKVKSNLIKVEKHPGGRAEIESVREMILTFSIWALPLEATFQVSVHCGLSIRQLSLRFLKDGVLIDMLNEMY